MLNASNFWHSFIGALEFKGWFNLALINRTAAFGGSSTASA